jgi:hypothetical protein
VSAHRELQLLAPPPSRHPVKDEAMLRKPSISRLLRAARRRADRVVARDTIPPLALSPDVTAADGTARSQAPASGTSTRSVHTVDIQWKPIEYGIEELVMVPDNWDHDTEAETTTDNPPVHRRISRVRQLVDSVVRQNVRPKSPLDTSSDRTLEVFDLPDPLACSGKDTKKSWEVRLASAPKWAKQKIENISRRRMAQRFKRRRLLYNQQALPSPSAVTDDTLVRSFSAFLQLPTTPGDPLIIHKRTEIGGMQVNVRINNLEGFGTAISIHGFLMQQ